MLGAQVNCIIWPQASRHRLPTADRPLPTAYAYCLQPLPTVTTLDFSLQPFKRGAAQSG